jgi:iron(III) transport system substrate-binding protein
MTSRHACAVATLIAVTLVVTACGERPSTAERPAAPSPDAGQPLIVFAARGDAGTAAALDAWRAETGGAVQLQSNDAPAGIVRQVSSIPKPDADLFLATSLAEIWAVAEADALRPTFSEAIDAAIAEPFRDPESRWVALSRRARVIAYNSDRVKAAELESVDNYAALGDERWRGRLCVSSSAVPGNRTLVAFLISRYGKREAELIVRRWRANLATNVLTDDDALLAAIADGRCGTGFIDSAVLAAYSGANPGAPVAAHWFADSSNTLTDISAAAVMRHADQPYTGAVLLEWLSAAAPNALFAGRRFEFPVNEEAALASAVAAWAERMPRSASYAELGFLLEEARLLAERARYP